VLIEFVGEPVGKIVLNNSGTHQNVLGFCFKVLKLNGKVPLLF
jgi:hypothetical protein